MKIEIQQYKGQTIEYDTETDKFVCDITMEDNYKNTKRATLSDLKKEIDKFIKNNLKFKPFKLIKGEYCPKVINVEGIRSDGRFVYRLKDSKSSSLVDFEKNATDRFPDDYFEYDSDFVKMWDDLEKEEEKFKEIISAKRELLSQKLKIFDWTRYKKLIEQVKSE